MDLFLKFEKYSLLYTLFPHCLLNLNPLINYKYRMPSSFENNGTVSKVNLKNVEVCEKCPSLVIGVH